MTAFSPGDLVRARGREWVALPSPDAGLLRLRPLSGAERDAVLLDPELEIEAVRGASFEPPRPDQPVSQDGARLLADALRMSLRRGAGPFRSAAHLGFEPRIYQLVPLLMSLRQSVIRLLIADDVGIGKTIEAGLVLRERIDRGEVERFAVLCPPHLVEQWTGELSEKFDLDAVAVTSASAARLERGLPVSETLFDAYPYTVVSLDYIKAEKRRDSFARACPPFIIVDEAHACVGLHRGRQQRFELLRRLAEDAGRHMLLLTATPHSGDEGAFSRLLSLLDEEFASLAFGEERFRQRLARHYVQRRRIDVTKPEWGEDRTFPRHETTEISYDLGADHSAFHEAVLDYCFGVVERAGSEKARQRLAFWGTLALMRCVGSSPAAALSALRNRQQGDPEKLEIQVYDEDSEDEDAVDLEPAPVETSDPLLEELVARAEELANAPDPKLEALIATLKPLLTKGSNPVVFCRFLATAEHVAAGLRKAFPKLRIEAVTGALTPDERRDRVHAMVESEQRLLVATDCLSEGINLQDLFDMVVHYDLSWNPTRHQQREGRVDRFGQPAELVRSILLFSPDSAIDGAVLEVILRKAEAIRKATGVTVPLPDERGPVTDALMAAMLLRRKDRRQLAFDLDLEPGTREVEARWRDAEENEKRSRAIFAQNAMRPEEVVPEWTRTRELLGGPEDVQRFVSGSFARHGAPLGKGRGLFRANIGELPESLRERLAARGLSGSVPIAFAHPAPEAAELVTRNHPITAILSESLLEAALDPAPGVAPIGRVGAWPTAGVAAMMTVLLLRFRFKLHVRARRAQVLIVEEAGLLAFGRDGTIAAEGAEAEVMLAAPATGDLAPEARARFVEDGLAGLDGILAGPVADHARRRAEVLAEDHDRLRAAGAGAPRVEVEPILPADAVGLFVLLPQVA